jgi:hypothetical protein
MRATTVRSMALAGALVSLATGCGRGGGAQPGVTAATAPAAPASSSLPAPTASPTGVSLRLSDGSSVVAVDRATGSTRARWADAVLSPQGTWTVTVVPSNSSTRARASWIDASGVVDHTGPVPDGLVAGLTSADGQWAVFVQPAPPRAEGEIGPRRTSTRLVVTDGAVWTKDLTLDGNFAPDAFGYIERTPQTLQLIEYLPPDHPTSYRVRTLNLVDGTIGLPVSLQDKATPVDQTMAGTSRTQVYAPAADLLFTLYKPVASGSDETWEYGFVHTLAPTWSGVYCIDLPEELGLEDHDGALALSWDQRSLFVVTNGGVLAEIHIDDPNSLAVDRVADLGVKGDERPVVAAGRDQIWVGIGRHLVVVDPVSLREIGRADLPAPVTALALDAGGSLITADTDHLREWSIGDGGAVRENPSAAMSLPTGLGPVARIVLP